MSGEVYSSALETVDHPAGGWDMVGRAPMPTPPHGYETDPTAAHASADASGSPPVDSNTAEPRSAREVTSRGVGRDDDEHRGLDRRLEAVGDRS